jgi:hypothetical protein
MEFGLTFTRWWDFSEEGGERVVLGGVGNYIFKSTEL